jgi:hypothetical protein
MLVDDSTVSVLVGLLKRGTSLAERPLNRIEDGVESLDHVRCEEAEYEIAVLLQELVLAPVPAISIGIGEVLRAVQLHSNTALGTEEIDLHLTASVEGIARWAFSRNRPSFRAAFPAADRESHLLVGRLGFVF